MKKQLPLLVFLLSGIISGFSQEILSDTAKTELEQPILFAEKPAEYPGGKEAMTKFLQENIRYPKKARKKGIEGKVYIEFIIEKDGSVSNVTVKKGVLDAPELGAEGARVVRLMPKWNPATQNGKTVRLYCMLPINFSLQNK